MLGVANFDNAIIAPIVIAAVILVAVLISVITFVLRAKKRTSVDLNAFQETITTLQQVNTGITPEAETFVCEYCGAVLQKSDNKCPNCGAPNRRSK